MSDTLHWLFQHATESHRPETWASILGIAIMDADGWRGDTEKDFEEKVGLPEFMERLEVSTIYAPI